MVLIRLVPGFKHVSRACPTRALEGSSQATSSAVEDKRCSVDFLYSSMMRVQRDLAMSSQSTIFWPSIESKSDLTPDSKFRPGTFERSKSQ